MSNEVITMTKEQLVNICEVAAKEGAAQALAFAPEREGPLFGLDGISRCLNVSKSTAYRLLLSGKCGNAIQRYGRKIVIPNPQALREKVNFETTKHQTKNGKLQGRNYCDPDREFGE